MPSTRSKPSAPIALILSNVVGDDLDIIASGPTAADPGTFHDALGVIAARNVTDQLPAQALALLRRGTRGEEEETPKPGDPLFHKVSNRIIASNTTAVDAALAAAHQGGLSAERHDTPLTGEAATAGRMLAHRAMAGRASAGKAAHCLISGGETTVTVRGSGIGGRNMELALAFALAVEGTMGISLLSAGSDGGDGPTDAAGAFVDGNTIALHNRQEALLRLETNDSYRFFSDHGGLFITGPTGTNVMDLQIVLLTENPPSKGVPGP